MPGRPERDLSSRRCLPCLILLIGAAESVSPKATFSADVFRSPSLASSASTAVDVDAAFGCFGGSYLRLILIQIPEATLSYRARFKKERDSQYQNDMRREAGRLAYQKTPVQPSMETLAKLPKMPALIRMLKNWRMVMIKDDVRAPCTGVKKSLATG